MSKITSALRTAKRLVHQTAENSIASRVAAGTFDRGMFMQGRAPGQLPSSPALLNPPAAALGYDDLPDHARELMQWLEDQEAEGSLAGAGYEAKLHGSPIPLSGLLQAGLFTQLQEARADYVRAQDHQHNYGVDLTKDERGIHVDAGLRQRADTIKSIEAAIADVQRQQATLRAKLRPVRLLLESLQKHILRRRQDATAKTTGKHSSDPKLAYENPFVEFDGEIRCTAKSIAMCDEQRARLVDEIKATENAPPSSSELKARAEAQINALAERGRIAIDGDGRLVFPRQETQLPIYGIAQAPDAAHQLNGYAASSTPDALPIIVNLFKDAILKSVLAQLPAGGITATEKAKKLAQLRAEKLDLERRECELIEAGGRVTSYRADTDPRAALRLAD